MPNENETEASEDLTPVEADEMGETGESTEEAHREGEFAELRDLLEKTITRIESLAELVKNGFAQEAAIAIEAGESINDDNPEVAIIAVDDDIPTLEELDLII